MTQYYWSYNEDTKEVFQAKREAKYMGGMYHMPRNSITFEPVALEDNTAAILTYDEDGNISGTELTPDFRKQKIYSTSDCTNSKTCKTIGSLDDGWTAEVPATDYDVWDSDAQEWVTDTDAQESAAVDAVKVVAIATRRDAVYADIDYGDYTYQMDYGKDSILGIDNFKDALIEVMMDSSLEEDTVNWITSDNQTVPLSYSDIRSIVSAFNTRKQDVFNQYQAWFDDGMEGTFAYTASSDDEETDNTEETTSE